MPKTELDLAVGAYESESLPIAAQQSVNMMPKRPSTEGASNDRYAINTPGIVEFANTAGPARGSIVFNGELYLIAGTSFQKISASGSVTTIGSVSGSGLLSLAQNGFTIAIIDPVGGGYFWDSAGGLQPITDPIFTGFGQVTSVTFKDGFFVYTTDKEFFIGSSVNVNKGQNFDALDFSTAEVSPDNNVRALTIQNELYIFGESTVELFQNTGGADFPFERINGASIDVGLDARFGAVLFDRTAVFLGSSRFEAPAIYRMGRGSVSKISTKAIDRIINRHTDSEIKGAFAWSYSDELGQFAGWTFPDVTIVYDGIASVLFSRPVWHTRDSGSGAWEVLAVEEAYGDRIALSSTEGKAGKLDLNEYTEFGKMVNRIVSGSYLVAAGDPVFVSELELFAEKTNGGQLGLSWSDDGGASFTDPKMVGLDETRKLWRRLGRMPSTRVFKVSTSDPVKVALGKMVINADRGF